MGLTVGKFLKSLPEFERERLLGSIPGDNFLRFAAESSCPKMFFAPVVSHHISKRWLGSLLFPVMSGEGVYQWGGRLTCSPRQTWLLRLVVMPAATSEHNSSTGPTSPLHAGVS